MSKLTLGIDPGVVERAKRYARRRGVSVSRLVQLCLDSLAQPGPPAEEPPVLRSLRGTLKRAGLNEYRKHLRAKYR